MSEFIVSARKYRPRAFAEVVGQEHITETLKNALRTGKIAHAFLFCGPRGVGKTTSARIMAKTLNCLNPGPDLEPCNECESCVSFNTSHSFNIHELDAASNNSVDDIRNLIEQVRVIPQIGKYSIYIIDEVHMLSSNAFNAFLKTLEEPPAHAIFILATTEKHKILPTILSRCQVFDFKRISVEDIAAHLSHIAQNEGVTCEDGALHIIAQKADGALRDALSIFDRIVTFSGSNLTYNSVITNLNILDYDYFFKVTDAALAGDYKELLLIFNSILNSGFDGQHFNAGLAEHFRNLLISRDKKTVNLLETGESIKEKYFTQGQQCSPDFLFDALKITNQADLDYRAAGNKRLLIELTLLRLAALKKKLESSAGLNPEVENDDLSELQKKKPVQSQPNNEAVVNESAPKLAYRPVKVESLPPKPDTISINPTSVLGVKTPITKPEVVEEVSNIPIENKVVDSFDHQKLLEIWEQYCQELKDTNKHHLYATFSKHPPVVVENNNIGIRIENKVQEDEIYKNKKDVLDFIRPKLKNENIDLITIMSEVPVEETKKMFTTKETFELMAEKNPTLISLKDKFDLNFDI